MKTPTILAIDDSKKTLVSIRYFLKNQGYHVRTAIDPARGLRLAQEGGIDLILLDIIMPKMDGYEVGDALKQDSRTRDIPVIMLTSRVVIWNTPKRFLYGLYGFLAKPFSRWDLRKVVSEALRLTRAGGRESFITPIPSAGGTEGDREPSES